jgi:hypothetical protein
MLENASNAFKNQITEKNENAKRQIMMLLYLEVNLCCPFSSIMCLLLDNFSVSRHARYRLSSVRFVYS